MSALLPSDPVLGALRPGHALVAAHSCGNCGRTDLDASDPGYGLVCPSCRVRCTPPLPVVPSGRTLTGRCAGRAMRVPNAAERWSRTLTERAAALAIRAERARRDASRWVHWSDASPDLDAVAARQNAALGPLPAFRSAWHEARRNALLCALAVAVLVAAWHWIA